MEAVECPYCGSRFSEVRETYRTLIILDGAVRGSWERAEELMSEWQEKYDLEKEAIVDRRHSLSRSRAEGDFQSNDGRLRSQSITL